MPRNSFGVYELPDSNPVVSGTIIESVWANETMDDIAAAITGSLALDGTSTMIAPLNLGNVPMTQSTQAVSKAYVDKFLAYATGMPIGAINAYGGTVVPPGWLLCDGSEVSRTTYAELFNTIGLLYGTPSTPQVFKLPDLRNEFIRGLGGSRTLGSKQAGDNLAHNHVMPQGLHSHTLVAAAATQAAHDHVFGVVNSSASGAASGQAAIGNPGDFGGVVSATGVFTAEIPNSNRPQGTAGGGPTYSTLTLNIPDHTHSISGTTNPTQPTITLSGTTDGSGTGVDATWASGGSENVPQNMALYYYIKAVEDFKLPSTSGQRFLGFFDASSGDLPQLVFPAFEFISGDFYEIGVQGSIFVYDPATLVGATTLVTVGNYITWVVDGTGPDGWYYTTYAPSTSATEVTYAPTGTISATDVQGAIDELDSETQTALAGKEAALGYVPVNKAGDTMSGSLLGPLFNGTLVIVGQSPTATNNFQLATDGAGSFALQRLGLGTNLLVFNPANAATFINDVTAFSDERLKKDWDDLPNDFVTQLSLVQAGTFTRIDTDTRQVGVSAQSLQQVLPEAVLTGDTGMLSVAYGNAALAACVELAKEVVALRARLDRLQAQ